MKVVLFCGGLGTRMREHSDLIPKPLVDIGARPIMWHLMRYYAHFGHKDFILCLGYKGDMIREYFLNYEECMSNDFVFSEGGKKLEPFQTDIHDWRITFVDTGLDANIGQRLLRVRKHLEGEEAFLANYADGLTDMPLNEHIEEFRKRDNVARFVATHPAQSFHNVSADEEGNVTAFGAIAGSDIWLNAGFFCFRHDIFDYIKEGEELVLEPFDRLMERKLLTVTRYTGFWQQMDSLREKMIYDRMEAQGDCPWMVWKK